MVSEKMDGVRALWDGSRLFTRGGMQIHAPAWFLAKLPQGVLLDGELWAGRGGFHAAQAAAARREARDDEWQRMRYMAFDAPGVDATFAEVYAFLQRTLPDTGAVQYVKQMVLPKNTDMRVLLGLFEAEGAEGFMLRRADSRYQPNKRSRDLLKVKRSRDAEATVVGYTAGTGRLEGKLGALVCRWRVGRANVQKQADFKVGTGFTDAERGAGFQARFPLGTQVTFKFMEIEPSGKPRHPVFFRRYVSR